MENENKVIPCENLPLSDEEIQEAAGGVIMATPLPNNTFICPVCKKKIQQCIKNNI